MILLILNSLLILSKSNSLWSYVLIRSCLPFRFSGAYYALCYQATNASMDDGVSQSKTHANGRNIVGQQNNNNSASYPASGAEKMPETNNSNHT